MEIFFEISIIIAIATLIAFIMKLLKQPLIISYIISGVLVGPYFFDIVKSTVIIDMFAQIGISFLLFIVGLNLNPQIIKGTGKVSLITGIAQFIFTSSLGFFICKIFGFSNMVSLYVSIALSFSSTIIIMKLLSDKGDLDTLYGRIAIGFLIVQDLIAMFALMIISSIKTEGNLSTIIISTLSKGVLVLILVFIIGKYIFPAFTKSIAKSQELLLLFSIMWVFVLSSVFYYLNFSIEIGALLAGITLSMSPYRCEISSKMGTLRDFFIVLFFIFLGSQMGFGEVNKYIIPIIILSLFVLIGNPMIVMVIMGWMGYTKRSSFLAGLTVAQISEFSLILITVGVKAGHLSDEILFLVTAIGLVTIAGSTYMILYAEKIYNKIADYLIVFERTDKKIDEGNYASDKSYDIILFGYNRIGYTLLKSFQKLKKKFLVVDYNPDTIIKLSKKGINCIYGDVNDIELLNGIDFSETKMVVSTIPSFETNQLIIDYLNKFTTKNAIIIAVSHQIDDAINLYKYGATYVIMPHFLGGEYISNLIEKNKFDFDKFLKEKFVEMKHLEERKTEGHEHPKIEKHLR
jgi:Kef-type K+ transport system membrane component KefB/Trk K+ transport system NAD-binding subunit